MNCLLSFADIWISRKQAAISSAIALLGCIDRCENVSMPYLFGIRLDCYMVNWFENVCNKKKNQGTKRERDETKREER